MYSDQENSVFGQFSRNAKKTKIVTQNFDFKVNLKFKYSLVSAFVIVQAVFAFVYFTWTKFEEFLKKFHMKIAIPTNGMIFKVSNLKV